MARFLVTVKRQEPNSRSVITTSINIEAENEINARLAAEGMARSRWPNCTIMVCEIRRK